MAITWLGAWAAIYAVTALVRVAWWVSGPSTIDVVSRQLLPRAALLTRLLARQLGGELSRTEVGLLSTLGVGAQRITALAELEGLAQPTMTSMVKQLEQRGLVHRERQTGDGRVVLVTLTEAGSVALADYRARARAVLGDYLYNIIFLEMEGFDVWVIEFACVLDSGVDRVTRVCGESFEDRRDWSRHRCSPAIGSELGCAPLKDRVISSGAKVSG